MRKTLIDQPFVTVVIPTYGREEPLVETIADVLIQDYPKFETIVIDQIPRHKPETAAYLQQVANSGQIQLYTLHDWASLPGARNYAVRRAAGDIIVFIDDDVRLEPDYLQKHVRNYINRPDIAGVAGRVFDRMKLADSQGALRIEQMPPEAMDPGIAWYYLDLVHTVKPQPVLSARGCNMSYRREIFMKHGIWFDERFRGSAVREESDFCLRIRPTGLMIWYDPEASLIHIGEPTGGCHDVSTQSMRYQVTFYHNHFFLGFHNLTFSQCIRFFAKLFDCHVLGHPPCNKSGSLSKVFVRFIFYCLGFFDALKTWIVSLWNDGQIYSRLDRQNHS